jgi:HSP20 family molecular chaperone IbpA
MSLFPRSFISEPSTSFTPLFRLLDEYGDYQSSSRPHQHRGGSITRTFAPKFDVKELPDVYELHGELPGIEQKDVDIEFTDYATLTVRGRVERSYSSGTPPTGGAIEGRQTEAIEGGQANNNHQPTVEDEQPSGQVTKTASKSETQQHHKEPEAKFWVTERSVGEFSRSFSFPDRVDQDGVRASMKNGILTVVVPKAKKQEKRKITIS